MPYPTTIYTIHISSCTVQATRRPQRRRVRTKHRAQRLTHFTILPPAPRMSQQLPPGWEATWYVPSLALNGGPALTPQGPQQPGLLLRRYVCTSTSRSTLRVLRLTSRNGYRSITMGDPRPTFLSNLSTFHLARQRSTAAAAVCSRTLV
jgi:hypothetical protein